VTRLRFRVLQYLWPRSLFGRLALILFVGLAAAHVLSFGLILYERAEVGRTMMASYFAKDVATAIAILDRVPAVERAAWLGRLARANYRYRLGEVPDGAPGGSELMQALVAALTQTLDPAYAIAVTTVSAGADAGRMRLHLRLSDGTPLTVALAPPRLEISPWVLLVLSTQLALLAVFTWIAVRLATRPLAQFARAADALGHTLLARPLAEEGPLEVAQAAVAFNAMQRRIAEQVAERIQILAAVSHDLQTPITRMRLRTDLLDDAALREKLHGDLRVMQALVEEGIAYARSAQAVNEPACRVDLYALLDSLACDYADAGRPIRLIGGYDGSLTTRPHTLRRVLVNLLDNALKFGTEAEIAIETETPDRVAITVRDRGSGIPPAELQAVLQPFYRVESSRNRETGGTGLGLAIAQQLTLALGGTLSLSNRSGGGLEARLALPVAV
jgi:signal transduction histidine kinase